MNAMIVDDSPDIRLIISEVMHKIGVSTCEFENGFDALKHILENKQTPYILITDLQMPRINGQELIELIEIGKFKIPLKVLISGYDRAKEVCKELVAINKNSNIFFIQKPFEYKDLISLVERETQKLRNKNKL